MSRSVHFISSALIPPGEIRDLVVSLGGEHRPTRDEPDLAFLERDEAAVNVWVREAGVAFRDPVFRADCARALGAPPRTWVTLELAARDEGQWPAAEVVLAAADRWPLVVLDLGEAIVTLPEFNRRVAQREGGFFLPTGYYDPAPGEWLRDKSTEATLLLPGPATPERLFRLVCSMGGWVSDDEDGGSGYAIFARGYARVSANARPPGFAPLTPKDAGVLGAPPYNSVVLHMSRDSESQLLAVELLEATRAHWPLLVQGASGQLMTLDDVRTRVAMGAQNLFAP